MNKSGFTLVELLTVIVLFGIVVTITVPSVVGINNIIKRNMLEKKVEIIEEAATLLGQDMKGSIISSDKYYNINNITYPCKSINVRYLVPNYLSEDNKECLIDNNIGCIVDPSDNTKYLDELEVVMYYKNKRIHVDVNVDSSEELTCR